MIAELTVIVPTYCEKDNIVKFINSLKRALGGLSWEAVFVDDDSPDGTAELVISIARKEERIRCIRRIGRKGLASACIEGMLASTSPYLAVIDADMQHDENKLSVMLDCIKNNELDIVIGSRYVEGGSCGNWDSRRRFFSSVATFIGRRLIKKDLKDPMSGFFMIRREFFMQSAHKLTGKGFKILLDIFASSGKDVRYREIPYHFRSRCAGESKLSTLVIWEYALLLGDKTLGRIIPVRFLFFAMVGSVGACVHMGILGITLKVFSLRFVFAQSIATFLAMTFNYFLNNAFTYRDQRIRGWKIIPGLVSFCAACGAGALINIAVATFLFKTGVLWWFSGLMGAVVGAVWNYAITSSFTWRQRKDRVVIEANR